MNSSSFIFLITNNNLFFDPLGQFEILNNFNPLTSLLKIINAALEPIIHIISAPTPVLQFLNNFSDFFKDYIIAQTIIFELNLACGLKLLPFLLLEPNLIYLNLVTDSINNAITKAYPLAQQNIISNLIIQFFSCSNALHTPLNAALINNLTFQDYILNFFIQDLYISQFVLTTQEGTLRTLNLFGLLQNQHVTQEPYTALLNAVLNPHNTSLFYQYSDFFQPTNTTVGQDFSIFTKLFGVSITESVAELYQNVPNAADKENQEVAHLIGLRLVLDYFQETRSGMERLCKNFLSVYDYKQGELSPFVYNAMDTQPQIDFLHLRINTKYNTDFWPEMLKRHQADITEASMVLINTLKEPTAGEKAMTFLETFPSKTMEEALLEGFDNYITQNRLSEVTNFAQAAYKIDKILTLEKHNYSTALINNNKSAYLGAAQHVNYELWCYFQHKALGSVVINTPEFRNNAFKSKCCCGCAYLSPLETAQTMDSKDLPFQFAALASYDTKRALTEENLSELDYVRNTNKYASSLISLAFEQCLLLLESEYVSAKTPFAATYQTEKLIHFMLYFVRGVLLNQNPSQFFEVPHFDAKAPSKSAYNSYMHSALYGRYLDEIVAPLRLVFNKHFGYERFSSTNELFVFLLSPENASTIQFFAADYGMEVLVNLFACISDLWEHTQKTAEFKLDAQQRPVSVFTNEYAAVHANKFLENYIDYYLDESGLTDPIERYIIGPYSLFSVILQQSQLLGVTLDQVHMIKMIYNREISQYEHLFNVYSDAYTKTFIQKFIETRFASIVGTFEPQTVAYSKGHTFNSFWSPVNSYNYLSNVVTNIALFNRDLNLEANVKQKLYFEFSILNGLLLNNQSVIIAFIVLIFSILFFILPLINNIKLIPLNWQYVMENIYKFILNILKAQVGKVAAPFFPYVFSVFSIILVANIAGMTLYAFTLTSHILVTFTLGVSSFLGLTILGFYVQNLAFLNLFLPKGIPTALIPILLVVEVISYVSRALSLSIRLFANLMSGHTLLHILAFFSSKLFKFKYIIGLLSFLLILAIVVLEFCIAMLQAYVFAILICIYLNDSFHGGH